MLRISSIEKMYQSDTYYEYTHKKMFFKSLHLEIFDRFYSRKQSKDKNLSWWKVKKI